VAAAEVSAPEAELADSASADLFLLPVLLHRRAGEHSSRPVGSRPDTTAGPRPPNMLNLQRASMSAPTVSLTGVARAPLNASEL